MKFGSATLVLAAVLGCMPVEAGAATGSIRITITRAQFVVGDGSGTLRLLGERYPLRVGGWWAVPTTCVPQQISTESTRPPPSPDDQEHSGCAIGKESSWNCADVRASSRRLI